MLVAISELRPVQSVDARARRGKLTGWALEAIVMAMVCATVADPSAHRQDSMLRGHSHC